MTDSKSCQPTSPSLKSDRVKKLSAHKSIMDNQTLDNCRNFGLRLQRPAPPAGAGRAGEESQGPKRSPELAETKVRAGAERVARAEELRKL